MARRDLTVNIDGDPRGFISAARRSREEAKKLRDEIDRINRNRQTSRAAEDMSRSFSDMFDNVGKTGPASIGLLAAAIVALPAVAAPAAAGVTAAFGAGLAGIGLAAAAQSAKVKGEFGALKDDVLNELQDIAAPLEDSLLRMPDVARRAFGSMAPELESAFSTLAPKVDGFVDQIAEGVGELEPALGPLADGFGALLDAVGARAPEMFADLRDAVVELADTTEEHADDVAAMMKIITGAVSGTASGIGYLADEWDRFLASIEGWLESAGAVGPDLDNSGEAVRRSGLAAIEAATGFGQLKDEMGRVITQAEALQTQLDELNGVHLAADEAASRYQEAVDRATESIKKNGETLSLNTEKGRANRDAARDIAQTAQDVVVSMAAEKRSTEEISTAYETYRGQLYHTLRQAGATRSEAKRLTDQWLAVPKDILTNARANTGQAWAAMGAIITRMETLRNGVTVPVRYVQYGPGLSRVGPSGALGQTVYGRAEGGPISGPGTGTSDDVLLWGSNGEFMVNAASTKKHRALIEAINADKFAGGGLIRGYAAGGPVGDVDVPLTDFVSRFMGGKALSKSDYLKVVRSQKDAVAQLRAAERKLAADRKSHRSAKTIADDEARVAKERRDLATATDKLTAASTRYNRSKLKPSARLGASLDLGIKNTGTFIKNIQKIADMGFPELAQQLLAMGGPEAEQYAADAAKLSKSKLKTLETKVKKAAAQQAQLEQLPAILKIKDARKHGATSVAAMMRYTGLSEEDIAEANAVGHLFSRGGIQRYAAGGLRPGPGIATRPTIMFGEGRYQEGFVPYDPAYRPKAMGLVAKMAGDFGMTRGVTRPSITNVTNVNVHGALDPVGTAREVEKVLRKLARDNGRVKLNF